MSKQIPDFTIERPSPDEMIASKIPNKYFDRAIIDLGLHTGTKGIYRTTHERRNDLFIPRGSLVVERFIQVDELEKLNEYFQMVRDIAYYACGRVTSTPRIHQGKIATDISLKGKLRDWNGSLRGSQWEVGILAKVFEKEFPGAVQIASARYSNIPEELLKVSGFDPRTLAQASNN